MYLAEVVGPDAGAQTKGAVIGQADGVLYVVERLSHQDRTEDLLLHQRAVLIDIGDQARAHEVPRAGGSSTAGDGGTELTTQIDIPLDPGLLLVGDERA